MQRLRQTIGQWWLLGSFFNGSSGQDARVWRWLDWRSSSSCRLWGCEAGYQDRTVQEYLTKSPETQLSSPAIRKLPEFSQKGWRGRCGEFGVRHATRLAGNLEM